MAKFQADENTVITMYGKTYNVQQFADEFCEGSIENAMGAMNVLLNDGRAKEYKGNLSKEQKAFDAAQKEESIKARAYEHETYEEMNKDYQADQKREGRLTYPCVEFEFPYPLKAQEFEAWVHNTLRVKNTEISLKGGQCTLKVYDVTDSELNAMSRNYKTEKFTQGAVGLVDKSVKAATDTVHYTATKIVAPVVQVGARAGASIFKTILTTMAKTAGTLISATAQGVKSAAHEIKHDPDVLKGSKEILEVGDAIRQKVNFNAKNGSGIRITR